MVHFTDNQKKALDLRRHMAITANAGAGKTAVLVERYIGILASTPAQIRAVVALTYTEKAASELRTKIAQSLEMKMRESSGAGERAAFERIRDQLPSATIGTIHSFCSQVLREFPLEADIDAGFGIIEEVERTSLLGQVLDETVARIGAGRLGDELRERLFSLVRILGRKAMEKYLAALLDKREQVDRMTGEGGIFSTPVDDDGVLLRWETALDDAIVELFGRFQWESHLLTLLPDGAASDELRRILKRLDGGLPTADRAELLAEAFGKIFTGGGTLRRRVFGDAAAEPGTAEHAAALLALYRPAKDLVAAAGADDAPEAARGMLEASKLLLEVYHACYAEYAARKADLGKLDFEDLQLKVRDLLRQPAIRERVSGRYSHILVDEFQDTNTLQYEIILRLLGDLTAGNLFVVGDPKQSIYGFRNAEVEVFQSSADRIAGSASDPPPAFDWGGAELPSTDAERRGVILLAESFRPLPVLAATVNALFRKLAARGRSPFDVPYTELATGRAGPGGGGVELLLVAGAKAGDAPRGIVRAEARSVARRIAGLHASLAPVAGKDGAVRPFRFSDCAVLLRRRANIRELELALAGEGVPYHLSGGVGFYQTQEVYDLYNLFRFLLNRDDDVALAGVLRSPFVALSDAELFEISRLRGGRSFWDKVLRTSEGGRGSAQLRFGVQLLERLRIEAARLPAPQLVQKVLAATGWTGTAASSATGPQRVANVRKLIRLMREFEDAGRVSLFDLVERLKGLVEEHTKEGQAALDPTGDAVRVMTIHAAKGLEFPVVVLPFLHEQFRYDTPLHIDAALGLGFPLASTAPALSLLRFRNRSRTEAEERRIFYVACTRARDLLVLSAHREARLSHESRYKWLLECLGKRPEELSEGRLTLEPEVLRTITPSGGRYVTVSSTVVPEIDILDGDRIGSVPAGGGGNVSTSPEPPGIFIRPVPAAGLGESISATRLRTYLDCPTKYYLRYVLGLPEQEGGLRPFDPEEDADEVTVADLEGSLAHRVLQEMGPEREQVERTIAAVVAAEPGLPQETRDAATRSLKTLISGCLESDLFREILGSKERRTEYSLSMIHNGDVLNGTIDCLYRSTGGRWALVDYKSDTLAKTDITRRAESYRSQIGFYAFLVSHYFQQESVDCTLLFLRHPGEPVRYSFGADELAQVGSMIESFAGALRRGEFKRNSRLCSHCTYRKGSDCLIPFHGQ